MKIRPPHSGALFLILIGIVVSFYFLEQADATLANPAVISGWILLGSFVLLCLYGARKKVPFLPIGKTATWLQLHLGFGANFKFNIFPGGNDVLGIEILTPLMQDKNNLQMKTDYQVIVGYQKSF